MDNYQVFIKEIPSIEQKLGYQFQDKEKLALAFTHSSYVNENKEIVQQSNERLEFLGDAVLGLLIADHLFNNLPNHKEGELSRIRSQIIESKSCAQFIKGLEIGQYLLMGKGEKNSFLKQTKTSVLADLFEAVIGAIYLDGGMGAASDFIHRHFEDEIQQQMQEPYRNWKAELQDYSQKKYQKVPVYKIDDQVGPDHKKTFEVSVFIDDKKLGSGHGLTKKSAQQAAAYKALEHISEQGRSNHG